MQEKELLVRDLGEAAALITIGYRLIRMIPSKNGFHKIFVFDRLTTSADDLNRYRMHDLTVDAYQFFINVKELKARVHDMADASYDRK